MAHFVSNHDDIIPALPDDIPTHLAEIFGRFTVGARTIVVASQEEARAQHRNYIGTEHLLIAVYCQREGVAAGALHALRIRRDDVLNATRVVAGTGTGSSDGAIRMTPCSRHVLEMAALEAHEIGDAGVRSEHILIAIAEEREGLGARVLRELGVDAQRIRQTLGLGREASNRA